MQAYNSLAADFKADGTPLRGLKISWNKDKNETDYSYSLTLQYRDKGKSNDAIYVIESTSENENVTYNYVGALVSGQNLLNDIPTIQDFLNLMCQEFTVTASKTKFNLNTLRFTSNSDPDFWFTIVFDANEDVEVGNL